MPAWFYQFSPVSDLSDHITKIFALIAKKYWKQIFKNCGGRTTKVALVQMGYGLCQKQLASSLGWTAEMWKVSGQKWGGLAA